MASLVFTEYLTDEESSRILSDVYRAIFYAQTKPNAAKMDNDPK